MPLVQPLLLVGLVELRGWEVGAAEGMKGSMRGGRAALHHADRNGVMWPRTTWYDVYPIREMTNALPMRGTHMGVVC